jgi:hypothetical protein
MPLRFATTEQRAFPEHRGFARDACVDVVPRCDVRSADDARQTRLIVGLTLLNTAASFVRVDVQPSVALLAIKRYQTQQSDGRIISRT